MEVHHVNARVFNVDDFVKASFNPTMPLLSDTTKCGSNMPDELALNINAKVIRLNSGELTTEDLPEFLVELHTMWSRIHFYNISKLDFIPIVINLHARINMCTPLMDEVMSYLDRMQMLDRIKDKLTKKK